MWPLARVQVATYQNMTKWIHQLVEHITHTHLKHIKHFCPLISSTLHQFFTKCPKLPKMHSTHQIHAHHWCHIHGDTHQSMGNMNLQLHVSFDKVATCTRTSDHLHIYINKVAKLISHIIHSILMKKQQKQCIKLSLITSNFRFQSQICQFVHLLHKYDFTWAHNAQTSQASIMEW